MSGVNLFSVGSKDMMFSFYTPMPINRSTTVNTMNQDTRKVLNDTFDAYFLASFPRKEECSLTEEDWIVYKRNHKKDYIWVVDNNMITFICAPRHVLSSG
jgi:hypothetical protein